MSQPPQPLPWPVWGILVSSLLSLLLLIGLVQVLLADSQGMVDVSAEQSLFVAGRFLALPGGLLALISTWRGLSRGLFPRRVALPAALLGVFNLLVGLAAWAWYFMVAAF